METLRIQEAVKEAPVKSGNRWRVIVARPGKGSSGTYSEEVFRRDAGKIIAPGGQAFISHDEDRDPRKMIGTYPEGAFWSEEDKAVVAELDVFTHWSQFVEEVGPHCGMSLYALGEQDSDGNVTAFVEDVYNGADLVSRPGLAGSGIAEKLYEAAINASSANPVTTPVAERKETQMDEDKVKEIVEKAIADAITPLVSAKETEAKEAAQVEANDEAVKAAVEAYDAKVKAITEAELSPAQSDSLREAAKAGAEVAPLIEQAKEIKADIEKSLTESADTSTGRIKGSETSSQYGAWK